MRLANWLFQSVWKRHLLKMHGSISMLIVATLVSVLFFRSFSSLRRNTVVDRCWVTILVLLLLLLLLLLPPFSSSCIRWSPLPKLYVQITSYRQTREGGQMQLLVAFLLLTNLCIELWQVGNGGRGNNGCCLEGRAMSGNRSPCG
jgi:hypothetical protein